MDLIQQDTSSKNSENTQIDESKKKLLLNNSFYSQESITQTITAYNSVAELAVEKTPTHTIIHFIQSKTIHPLEQLMNEFANHCLALSQHERRNTP